MSYTEPLSVTIGSQTLFKGNVYRVTSYFGTRTGTLTYIGKKDSLGNVELVIQEPGKPRGAVFFAGPGHKTTFTPVEAPGSFSSKLALVNTKLKADPGLLSNIMKFHKPTFKPGPWTEVLKAQRAVAASEQRKETAKQEEEALAAMKTGGRGKTAKRRKRSNTSRRKTRR